MILLAIGTETLTRLMRAEARGPDTAWLLAGPTDPATIAPPDVDVADADSAAWPLAAE